MGNVLDSAPSQFSQEDPTKMQANYYTQTYKHNPQSTADSMTWGTKGSHLNIGAKVLQDMNNNQLYITNNAGQKVYITKNGQQVPNAKEIIKTAQNYGEGPLVEITGSPLNPQMYMWTSNDMTAGQFPKAMKIPA